MPVLSRCPLCRGVMPDSRGESRCPRCGELVVAAVRKLCATCGTDVSRAKRVRGDDGEYYCHPCWDAKLAARGEEVGYLCNACDLAFASDQVYQDGDEVICHDCYANRAADPDALVAAADGLAGQGVADAPTRFAGGTPSSARPAPFPWGPVSFAIAVFIALVVLLVVVSVR
jgi:ribosomal protein L37E